MPHGRRGEDSDAVGGRFQRSEKEGEESVKKIGIVLGIFLLLVFAAAILAPFVIDLNQHKDRILSEIQPYVPRDVDFQHLELTVLSGLGVELRGFRVSDNPAFSMGDFLQLESLQLRVMVLPLLKKQIKIKRITLKRPVVRLARNAAGAFSFHDLLASDESGAAGEGRPAEEPPGQEEAGGGLGLLAGFLVDELEIQHGRMLYEDEMLWPGGKPLVIDALDVEVRDLAIDRSVSIRVKADLLGGYGQNFDFAGTVGPVGTEVQVEAVPFAIRSSLKKLPVGALLSLLPNELPLKIRSGTVSVRWEAKGSLERQIVSEGEVDLEDLRLEMAGDEGGGSPSDPLGFKMKQKVVLEYAAERLLLESLDVSVDGGRLRMQGTVEAFRTDPQWALKAWSEGFRPENLVVTVPALAQALPEGLHFQGPLAIHLESVGGREEFRLEARADLEGMNIQFQDVFQKPSGGKFFIGCKANKKGELVTLRDLELLLHTLAANASGELILSKTPRFGLLVQTNPVALEGWDSLCPMLSPYQPTGSFVLRSSLRGTPEDASLNVQVSSDRIGFQLPPQEAGSSDLDRPGLLESCSIRVQARRRTTGIQGGAQAEIRKGEVLHVPFEKLLASARYSPDLFEMEGFELNVFRGGLQATGHYDPAEGTWGFRPTLKDVAVGEVLDRLTEYKDNFSGSMRGEFVVGGSTQVDPKADVSAEGSFRISDGELKNFNLVGSVMDALFGIQGMDLKLSASSRKEVREHESTRFDWLEGAFEMKGETLFLKGLQLRNIGTSRATDSDALLEGSVDLESQLLDMKGKVILSKRDSEELAGRSEVLKALYNAEQRIVLPFALKGNAQKPMAFLDTEYVLGAVSRHYTREGVERLRKQLGLPEETQNGEEKVGERLLRDLLRRR